MKPNTKPIIIIGIIVSIVVFAVGYMLGSGRSGGDSGSSDKVAKATVYTCSMHPNVRTTDPTKKCPLCFMDLIPVEGGDMANHPSGLKLSPEAQKLAQVETVPVARTFVTKEVRMVGVVEFDETRLATITAWVPGRLDRLYVDYTGITVKQGDHMVYIYSPDILTAEQELIEAKQSLEQVKSSELANVVEAAKQTLEASRDKLRLWGLSQGQIAEIEQRGEPDDHITINAPIGGIVIKKQATQGEYVKTGTPIYQIADLSQLWVQMDAYESDLPWLRYGQSVEFTAEAFPGRTFQGKISFIAPTLDKTSRTVKVRVNLANDGSLKPGMFVRAVVKSRLAEGAKVFDDSLAGKWISPMHPEVVKDGPGPCDVCGMPLVKAETLGYIAESDKGAEPPLVIPATAPLVTGERAVVYVQDREKPEQFTGQVVKLGPRTGDFVVVEEGLEAGDLVVVNGNFKIDSELQIKAKESMMSLPSEPKHSDPQAKPVAERSPLEKLFFVYLDIQKALSKDSLEDAQAAAGEFFSDAEDVELKAEAWPKQQAELSTSAKAIFKAGDIDAARSGFATLSDSLSVILPTHAKMFVAPVYKVQCPMAFNNRGASWLQDHEKVENPYFGSSMFACGRVVEDLKKSSPETGHHNH